MRTESPLRRAHRRAVLATTVIVTAAAVLSGCTSNRHPSAPGNGDSAASTAASTNAHASSPSSAASPAPPASPTEPAEPTATLVATLTTAHLPQALSRVVAVAMGGKVLIVGGLTAREQTTAAIEMFDPSAGTVTAAGHLPHPVHDAAAGVIAGRGFVAGGGAATTTDAVQEVHADGTASLAGRLPQQRSDDSAAVSGNTLYVAGGYDGSHEVAAVLATTNGVTFTQVGQLGETVRYGAAYAAGHVLWMFGGEHHGVATADIQRIDAATGHTSVVATLPHPLAHEAVVAIGGHVLIIGGTDGHTVQDTIYAFDPSTNTVTTAGILPESVSDMAAVVAGDTAYIIGGNALTAKQRVTATTAIVAVKMQAASAHASG